MSRCKYIFVRGPKGGEQCDRPATVDGFCAFCCKRIAKDFSNTSTTAPIPSKKLDDIVIGYDQSTGLGVADTSKLQFTETFGQLCEKIIARDLLREAENCCRSVGNHDISLDITATGKFIAQLQPKLPSSGFECRICVINKRTVACQYGMFSIPLFEAGPWSEVSTFMIKKNMQVTDAEALAAILWQLTSSGWPDEYYQWLEVDRNNLTLESFHKAVKQKLRL